jgi:hypothetical protein
VGSSPIGEIRPDLPPGQVGDHSIPSPTCDGPFILACSVNWALRGSAWLPSALFQFRLAPATPGQRGEFGDLAHRQSTCNTIGHIELYSRWFGGPRASLGLAPTTQHFRSRRSPPGQRGEIGCVAHRQSTCNTIVSVTLVALRCLFVVTVCPFVGTLGTFRSVIGSEWLIWWASAYLGLAPITQHF